MEQVCIRFPHVIKQINKELDFKTLVRYKEANRIVCDVIDNQKQGRYFWMRIIHTNLPISNCIEFKEDWKNVLSKTDNEYLMKHDEIMLKSPVAAGTSGQQQPSPLAGQQVVVTGGGGNAAQLLPTVPVPAASLVGQRLPSGRVTLQNLRSIPGGGGGQQVVTPVKVRTIVVNMYVLYRQKGHA